VVAQLLLLGWTALRPVELDERLDLLRQTDPTRGPLQLQPGAERVEGEVALRRARDVAAAVPPGRPAALCVRQPRDDHARLEANSTGRDHQLDPDARGGQRSEAQPLGAVVAAERDEVLAPVSAVLPVTAVPLHHDLLRRVLRVEVDVSEERVTRPDAQL